MKLTIIGTQSVCQSVHHTLTNQKNRIIEFHQIPIKYEEDYFNNTMLTYKDLWNIQTSDAICLFGTWGSDNRNRQWHPKTNKRRQAYNLARKLPGAAKSSYNNLIAYRNYLKSQGADVTTIPFSIFDQLLKHPLTEAGLKKFLDDAKGITW